MAYFTEISLIHIHKSSLYHETKELKVQTLAVLILNHLKPQLENKKLSNIQQIKIIEYLSKASLNLKKKIQSEFSIESNLGVKQVATNNGTFIFNWNTYKKIKELTEFAEALEDELIKNDKLLKSNN
ncbi:686_t:CDS:2, partial [Cetraspora pellucida]